MHLDTVLLTAREKAAKAVGRGMLAWSVLGMPFMSFSAYAQGLPGQAITTQQRDAAVQDRRVDDATSDTLINQRASRLLGGRYNDNSNARGPRVGVDEPPVRNPNIKVDPTEEARAKKQAERAGVRTRTEIIQGAESGGSIGRMTYQNADLANQTTTSERVNPGVNQTTGGRTNISEVVPGFTKSEFDGLESAGTRIFNNPEVAREASEQHSRNIRRDGCRKTDFVLRDRQNLELAASGASQRILKVEFFELVKEPISGTNPVEYQTVTRPTTYKGGTVNLDVATLGATSTVYWDKVSDVYAVRYTYTPYSNPKGRNYFTYNHGLGYSTGGAIQRINNGVVSYGSPSDAFKPVLSYTLPNGTTAIYLTADLYQTQVNFNEPQQGVPCPSDPPAVCDVPSIGGDTIRWCPGSPGANIASMYDDLQHASMDRFGKRINDQMATNATRKDFSNDPAIRTAVTVGVNAATSDKAQELIGQCTRDSVSRIEHINKGSYGVPNIQMCSEYLENPYAQGCTGIKRSFGMSYMGDHNYLTVKAFNKIKVPIIDPGTGQQVKDTNGNPLFTYRKEPANVQGAIDTNFTIMGPAQCPGNTRCSTEKPDNPLGTSEGPYVEYFHYPMGGDPKSIAIDGVFAQAGASSNFTNFGLPSGNWLPTGSASGDGTLHEVRLMAKAYSVTINTFAGCENYMGFVADGFCKGGKLTCKVTSSTRTVSGVTFGPGLANQGIVELLKQWGTESSAVVADEYENSASGDPIPNGPPIKMLDDPMCWEADAQPFASCTTVNDSEGKLLSFMRNDQKWLTDCNLTTDDNDVPLNTSTSCKRLEQQSCDSRFLGAFTGQCYNPTINYDCGTTKDVNIPVIVEELGDACSGAMRCIGTECHRPNLAGTHGGDFATAVGAMEAVNAMVEDMICLETGEKPTSVDQVCTPYIFGGKPMYCKIPIGNEIGLTPNCCKEARKGASVAPGWMEYLAALQTMQKLGQRLGVMEAMKGSDIYSHISSFFGEVKAPVADAYINASKYVTDQFITPFRAGFDNLFGGGAAPIPVDGIAKTGAVDTLVQGFQQQMMQGLQSALQFISPDLSSMVIQTGTSGGLEFTPGMENLLGAFQIYSIARLIGHIIFACKQEEFEWGMNDKWRLCTFADSCCSKKVPFIGCVEKRQLYCCYKSIATRVISTQLITKNLTGSRAKGFRTANDGRKLGGCNINCGGFTAFELAAVDWSKVDLTEWTDALIESGQLNPADPRTNYGVSKSIVKEPMTVGRDPDPAGNFTTNVPAYKSAELLGQNTGEVMQNTQTLQEQGEHCYDGNDKKMPFVYPGCRTTP